MKLKLRVYALIFGVALLSCILVYLSLSEGRMDRSDSAEPSTVHFTVFTTDPGAIKPFENNWFTRFLENKFNVNMKWITLPSGEAAEKKKQLLLSGNNYPELFMSSIAKDRQYDLGRSGILVPLNDLIEEYAPNLKRALRQNPKLLRGATSPDGNIYAIPALGECFHCSYSQKMWINKNWLDELGLPLPRTTEEFRAVMEAFKNRDPNGNGLADEIPLSGSSRKDVGSMTGYIMNAFIHDDNQSFVRVNEGNVSFIGDQPAYRQGLEYLHKLYTAKLIDPNVFSQSVNTFKEKVNRNPAVVGAFVSSHVAAVISLTSPLYKDYAVLPPLIGPEGLQTTGYWSYEHQTGYFAITNKASPEQAAAIIKVIDYLFTEEGTIFASYGKEGDGWEKAPAGSKDFNGNPAKYRIKPAYYSDERESWGTASQVGLTDRLRGAFAVSPDLFSQVSYEYRLYKETKTKYEPYRPKEYIPSELPHTTEELRQVDLLRRKIGDYLNDQTVQFVMGAKDLDQDWASYAAEYKQLNVDYYVELTQRAYDFWKN